MERMLVDGDIDSRHNRNLGWYATSLTPPPVAGRSEGSSARTRRAATLSRPLSRKRRPRLAMEFRTEGMRPSPMLGGSPWLR